MGRCYTGTIFNMTQTTALHTHDLTFDDICRIDRIALGSAPEAALTSDYNAIKLNNERITTQNSLLMIPQNSFCKILRSRKRTTKILK